MTVSRITRRLFQIFLVFWMISAPAFPQHLESLGKRKLLSSPEVIYPRVAEKMKLRGSVKIAVFVAADGHAMRTEVLGGSPVFVPNVLDAIKRSKWQAAPEESRELVTVDFVSESQ
jgi:outer membrane biosynthesis protein TonB